MVAEEEGKKDWVGGEGDRRVSRGDSEASRSLSRSLMYRSSS